MQTRGNRWSKTRYKLLKFMNYIAACNVIGAAPLSLAASRNNGMRDPSLAPSLTETPRHRIPASAASRRQSSQPDPSSRSVSLTRSV